MLTHHAVRVALIFAAAGLLSRFTFRLFETRWQLAIFIALACIYQLVIRPALGKQVSIASLGLDCAAVSIAIIAMKIAIEGRITH